jgi:hypothetical protein
MFDFAQSFQGAKKSHLHCCVHAHSAFGCSRPCFFTRLLAGHFFIGRAIPDVPQTDRLKPVRLEGQIFDIIGSRILGAIVVQQMSVRTAPPYPRRGMRIKSLPTAMAARLPAAVP